MGVYGDIAAGAELQERGMRYQERAARDDEEVEEIAAAIACWLPLHPSADEHAIFLEDRRVAILREPLKKNIAYELEGDLVSHVAASDIAKAVGLIDGQKIIAVHACTPLNAQSHACIMAEK